MKKILEGITILIFLILAPFNLGYYSYKLVGEFIDKSYTINTPTSDIAGVSDSDFENIEKVIPLTDNFDYSVNKRNKDKDIPTPVITKAPITTTPEATAGSDFSYRPSQLLFICVNDSGAGDWQLINNDRTIANVDNAEAAPIGDNSQLLMNCQRKIRLFGLSTNFTVKRTNKKGETIEQKIILEKSFESLYLQLKFTEGSTLIDYTVKVAD